MKVSEKSLELNIGAELLGFLHTSWGMPKAYLRGLTQREESEQGVDFFAQLSPAATIMAFQFKAPKGRTDGNEYRYTLVSKQHNLLYDLAQKSPGSVFYVFPFYVTPTKLHRDVPDLAQDTWLLRVDSMPTATVFNGQRTKVVRCSPGVATINPQYPLVKLSKALPEGLVGMSAQAFASWYARMRVVDREQNHRNPWLVRGLRIVVIEPLIQ